MAVEVSSVKTDARKLGDLLRCIFHPAYNYVSATLKNPDAAMSAANAADPLGLPVKLNGTQWELVDAADIANIGGVLAEDKPIETLGAAATGVRLYRILVRGPATVHEDGLRLTDHLGASINQTNFKTALAGLDPKIITIEGPDKTSTQST